MLIMNNNSLSGSINLNCSAMKNLTSLGLGSNQFHVPISRNLSGCLRLEAINLARNHLNAGVPVTLKNLQSLTQLSVSNSSLHNLSATLESEQRFNPKVVKSTQEAADAGSVMESSQCVPISYILDISRVKMSVFVSCSMFVLHRLFHLQALKGTGVSTTIMALQHDHQKLEIIGFPFGFDAVAGFLITIAICFTSG
ncbi:Phytosulfokine receptor 1 [Glycine soja]|uniref:Phytosulfokine receptor 1 n=2 Tax=Glycine subgen. Soja TaxID=1462606 RepID=A0A445GE45_GLYSO|nr:Phytosulfokine receptor 1 [Glycine soja]